MPQSIVSFIAVFLLSTLSYAGEQPVRFIYSGFDFYVPAGATVIGSQGGPDNFTFFRYGDKKGKDYLAFTDITDEAIDYGCKTKEFYAHLAGLSGPSTCSKQEIDSFNKVFVQGAEVGSWSGSDLTSYYFYKDDQAFLFVFSKDKVIKIDTDHLSKSGLKSIIKKYI